MKKIKNMLLTMLVLSLTMIPMVFAKEELSIKSYELVDNSKTTTELSKPKINGLNISFDLSFSKANDFAKYKIIINNPTDKDYELSKDTDFNNSDYISYLYEFEKDSNIVAAKSKVTMFITITYKNVVPVSKLVNGKYIEDNNMAISLSYASSTSKTEEEVNPSTGNNILIICVLALTIALLTIILVGKNKRIKYTSIFILSMILIPTTILALEKMQMNIVTKITIEEKYQVAYTYTTTFKESEKDKYSFTTDLYNNLDSSCLDYSYLIEGEKYIICEVYTESYHSPGERISVNPYLKNYVYTSDIENGAYVLICDYDADSQVYTCPKKALHENVEFDEYSYVKADNYEYQENDPEIMNINNIKDKWEVRGYISFYTPNSFTMPNHNVIIREAVQGK